MKCPNCLHLNAATDVFCLRCGAPLPVSSAALPVSVTPQWAYLFAVFCGIIPVISLGGAIPIVLGVGGAGACLAVSRRASLPTVLRLLACLGITLGCWFLFAVLLAAVFQATR